MATTVDEKLNMSLDDIVMENAQQQQQPLPTNGASGKTRNKYVVTPKAPWIFRPLTHDSAV
jgi:hypothetical protein